jgi:hypothetical protein
VLGIKLTEEGKICIRPSFSKELTFAKGEYRSVKVKIYVEWQNEGGMYRLSVEADGGVDFDCDFTGREIITMERKNGRVFAVVK